MAPKIKASALEGNKESWTLRAHTIAMHYLDDPKKWASNCDDDAALLRT